VKELMLVFMAVRIRNYSSETRPILAFCVEAELFEGKLYPFEL